MRVDFYLLQAGGDQARLQTACKLCSKAYDQGQRVHVQTADMAQAQRLDELLWTFADQSFIPHGLSGTPEGDGAPITIGPTHAEAELLINLGDGLPEAPQAYERILEIVGSDDPGKQQARERYRRYRDELSAELHTHELTG